MERERPTERRSVGAAAGAVVGQPALWLLGALGFAARGGIVLLALPIITIPSPVILSILLRGQLDSTGLTITPLAAFVGMALVIVFVVLPSLTVAAFADVMSFKLLSDSVANEDGSGREHRLPDSGRRPVAVLTALGLLAAIPIALATVVSAGALYDAVLASQTLVGSGDVPLALRVLAAVPGPVLLLLGSVVAADAFYAVSSRAMLAGALRAGEAIPAQPAPNLLHETGRTLAVVALSWLLTLAVLAPVLWATATAWTGVRNGLLSLGSLTDIGSLPVVIAAILLFTTVWTAGLLLCGFGSALRGALWSAEYLH